MATGVDFIGLAIRLALGESISIEELHSHWQRGCAIRYVFGISGETVRISGTEEIKNFSGVEYVDIPIRDGLRVEKIIDHTKRLGCVITAGETTIDSVRQAEEAIAKISIETIGSY